MKNKLTLVEWAYKNGFQKHELVFINNQQEVLNEWEMNELYKEYYLLIKPTYL